MLQVNGYFSLLTLPSMTFQPKNTGKLGAFEAIAYLMGLDASSQVCLRKKHRKMISEINRPFFSTMI